MGVKIVGLTIKSEGLASLLVEHSLPPSYTDERNGRQNYNGGLCEQQSFRVPSSRMYRL